MHISSLVVAFCLCLFSMVAFAESEECIRSSDTLVGRPPTPTDSGSQAYLIEFQNLCDYSIWCSVDATAPGLNAPVGMGTSRSISLSPSERYLVQVGPVVTGSGRYKYQCYRRYREE